jgi:hypothetical protein
VKLCGHAGALLVFVLSLATSRAAAAGPLSIEARPILGTEVPAGAGWLSVALHVRNATAQPVSGKLELVAETQLYGRGRLSKQSKAPYAVPARGSVLVRLPISGSGAFPSLTARALDENGNVLAETALTGLRAEAPLLFDLSPVSRVAPALRGAIVQGTPAAGRAPQTVFSLAVGTPDIERASGDPILPERAAGYAACTVVLAETARLASMPETELRALGDWVLAGGALALSIARPEDLERAPLTTLIGGRAFPSEPDPALLREDTFLVRGDSAPDATPLPSSSGTPDLAIRTLAPADSVRERLTGFRSANLRVSPWGASASYGLGEVHLLAFDPGVETIASSDWVQLKLAALVAHAARRPRFLAFSHGQRKPHAAGLEPILRLLDPNEQSRWTIAVSAVLLVLYALAAGPLNFYQARRRGRPLVALAWLPLWALIATVAVIGVGMAGRGVSGRARHLTVVESAAGMTRAAATRFRSFFANSTDSLTVRESTWGSVLDVVEEDEVGSALVVDGDGARLESLQARPWQAVVVREDGFADLGGGISVVGGVNDDYVVTNRTAHDLLGVVVKTPGRDAVFFERIAGGASARVSEAKERLAGLGRSLSYAAAHPLDASTFAALADRSAAGLSAAWAAVEAGSGHEVDWWPHDVPVLIAALGDAEAGGSDAGLRVEADRTLIRVLGTGGVP